MWMSTLIIHFLFNLLLTTCGQKDDDTQALTEEEKQKAQQKKVEDMMKHDGVKRVITLTEKNHQKVLKKNEIVVTMFWVNNGKDSEKLSDKDTNFLEVIAQLFSGPGKKIAVASCEIMSNQKLAKDAGVRYTGMIKIFNRGRTTTYYGQRSTDVLFPYLAKMMTHSLSPITTKGEKKQCDGNDLPKVIAYVEENSKTIKELANAAYHFQPMIPFYVVYDAKLAKSFHLKKLNSLQLVKPYEKAVSFSKKNLNEESIVNFINLHKRQRITKMRLENLHEVWAIDGKGYVVPVFAITKTEEGNRFFSVAKALSKHFEKNDNLTFIWIDPEPFPAMVDYWSKSFKIDPSRPTIGIVDVHAQTSAWYQRSSDGGFDQNDIKKWMADVIRGKIELVPIAYKPSKAGGEEKEEEVVEDKLVEEESGEIKQEL